MEINGTGREASGEENSPNGVNGHHGMNGLDGSNGVNGNHGANGLDGPNGVNGAHQQATSPQKSVQDPIAVVGLACRLPDKCHTTHAFWKFIEGGGIAQNRPPASRFNVDTHHDGSLKNKTMASPGGMFLQGVDVRDIDAQFFKLSRLEALAMDPQQRQLLEVVYEGLENAGITLEQLHNSPVGCFVGSFAGDYGDMQTRDPEDRAAAATVGTGRAMLSNRISHFLNIKGPSMTIDTACSGSLTGVDVANRYLQTGEIKGAIVAGANIYLSPEHVMDHHMGANGTASLSGKCHTFDEKADGYIKAEAVNMVYLKRLDDALHDGDPVHAIIRGTATGSDGWTAGIASPNSEAQAEAIRQAYANAGISDLSMTSYVECHGTGTRAGDVIEVNGISSVFRETRSEDNPLRIGSVKSNIGHSEPAAGISGLLKAVLSLQKGIIPGNPTFEVPNPNLDFHKLRTQPSKVTTRWPLVPFRRASVNSFGYGGSNAHVIVDAAPETSTHVSSYLADSDDIFADDDESVVERPYVLVLSANDDQSLRSQIAALDQHLSDPAVDVKLRDLAYTLSEKRTRHYHRGFLVADSNNLDAQDITLGTLRAEQPKIGFVFTGQGAQWVQMGKDIVATFPVARECLEYLEDVLRTTPDPPKWSLLDKLTTPQVAEDLRLPELSQPLVTALQLSILAVLNAAGVSCNAVAGHSSGEIAAAVAAGYLTPENAIKIAYYRGKATSNVTFDTPVGMLAVGLGVEKAQPYLDDTAVQIACINSPDSVTLSGKRSELQDLESNIKKDGHFARLLQVDAAYHSKYMAPIADEYLDMLERYVEWPEQSPETVKMFSSTEGKLVSHRLGPSYWVKNMVSPVLFYQAVQHMISPAENVDLLIEIGPSNALSGPVNQIKKAVAPSVEYLPAWKRGSDALKTMLDLAGKLFIMGCDISMAYMNKDAQPAQPSTIVDLPNYSWNHSTKHWHESESSSDWRFRKFVHHDLLGNKILGSPWTRPAWKKAIKLEDLPWLRDHKLGDGVVFPASGYIAMAIEAIFQKSKATGRLPEDMSVNQSSYKLRNVTFFRALPIDDQESDTKVILSLNPCSSTPDTWHEFKISSIASEITHDHCQGLVSLSDQRNEVGSESDLQPLRHGTPAAIWYKAMHDVGYSFGPSFQKQMQVESIAGQRRNRAIVSFAEPESKIRQSLYPLHPVTIDSCFQTGAASLWSGHRSSVSSLMLPAMIDDLSVMAQTARPETGVAVADAEFTNIGREDDPRRYKSNVSVYNTDNGELLFRLSGLHYHALDASIESHASHTYTRVTWQPDISFLSNNQLAGLLPDPESGSTTERTVAKVGQVINLVAHKNPRLRLLEIDLVDVPDSVWIDRIKPTASDIATDLEFHLSVGSQTSAMEARSKYGSSSNAEVGVHDLDKPFDGMRENGVFEVILLKASPCHADLQSVMESAREKLADMGYLFVLYDTNAVMDPGLALSGVQTLPTTSPPVKGIGELQLAYIGNAVPKETSVSTQQVHLLHFQDPNETKDNVKTTLAENGWDIIDHTLPFDDVPENGTVLVLDEIISPVMSDPSDEQFAAIQGLIQQKCRILWVTRGGHMKVTNPEHAPFFGAARSLHGEDPTVMVMSLDIEDTGDPSTTAINTALEHLNSTETLEDVDYEFVERDGIIHISRVIPDKPMNQSEKDSTLGLEPKLLPLHNHPSTVRLISTRQGAIDSLQYAEQPGDELSDRDVEVEIHAAALNFKDLANAMGFVASNERRLGLECTGVVTRRGKDATAVSVGDRVLLIRKDGGGFGNKVTSVVEGVQRIPDWMSFEDASTLGVCFMTAIYSLMDLANTQRGQTVLIHSAAGGVGLAAIQICRYLGAEIYVTVGSAEKREFLKTEYGIPEDRMFSSRSISFAAELMEATRGRGMDVVLNSLTGDLLHESWRCLAENGNFIEIGKKDLLERNSLSMEPFSRNASYRSFDLSLKSVSLETFERLMSLISKFVNEGIIKPLPICKTFSSAEVTEAFRFMRDGKHIGKIVVSDSSREAVKVPIIPALPQLQLRSDVSYLIVGGFKGLCGSLALYLARNGAKNLVVISRSGYDDPASQSTIYHLKEMGTNIELARGDITNIDDMRRAFSSARAPIAGIIQGAMVLKDKMFPAMTADEFRAPIYPKVAGTWNLHRVSDEQGLKLDFFTLLSSVSGVVGQKAQSNYNAGNVFLDSFAAYRQAQGLPACSVNLGVIEDVGYLTERDHLSRRLESQGWTPINESLLHKILRFSILQQQPQTSPVSPDSAAQLITGIPVPLLAGSPLQPFHRFSPLRPTAGSSGGAAGGSSQESHLATLKNAGQSKGAGGEVDYAALLASAVEAVNAVLMRSLGMKEPLEVGRPLASYGIDSLVAVELRNWARSELGVEISALDIVGAKTLVALCEAILKRLLG